ncbi:MAG TPA: M48 family metalloprotease [Candidatus Sulfotelmatobacter sp.]|nr:M48 family metalloprotease [Candidatus Sulfotelmatobacter sp.]
MHFDPLIVTIASFLVLPLALGLWARANALQSKDTDPAPAWFSFSRRLQLIGSLHPLLWYLTITWMVRNLPTWPSYVPRLPANGLVGMLVGVLVLPFVANLPLNLLRHDVARRLGTTELGWPEALRQLFWTFGATVVPLTALAIGIGSLPGGHVIKFAAWALPGLLIGAVCASQFRRGLGLLPHAITQGELRDHLFALAERAGVRLSQLYVLPMKRTRMANAFAVNGGRVMLTDLLLQQLTREQVDAVMAHEIGHLRRSDPMKLAFSRLFFPLGAGLALQPLGYAYSFLGFLAGGIAATAWSRQIERATDREALRLGASGEALISGLVRIARLSFVPITWNKWSGWYLSHPSVEARALAIGRDAHLPESRVRALLAGEEMKGEHYEYTPAQAATERLFSTPYKATALARSSMVMLLLAVGAPAVFARLALEMGLHHGTRPWLWPAAILATFAACLMAQSMIALAPLRALRGKLAARLHLGPASASPGWRFVGLSPHADPRVYEGFSTWDLGFVRVSGPVLEFLGEETRFALRREQLVSVALVDGPPSWLRTRVVRIAWNVGGGREGLLRLTPLESASVGEIGGRARALVAEIERWRLSEDALAARIAPRESVPPSGEVTSIAPRQIVRPALFVRLAMLDTMLAAVAALAFGLPFDPAQGFGWLEIAASGLAVQALMLWPVMTARRPIRRAVGEVPQVIPIETARAAKSSGDEQSRAA